jgi:S1-C subfamily serine protease
VSFLLGRAGRLAAASVGLWLATAVISEAAAADEIPPAVSQRVAQVLGERHVDLSAKWPGGAYRGLRDVFHETASAVPLVITKESIGSSVVIRADRKTDAALLVTNHHVVTSPFFNEEKKTRFVVLVFYEPALAKTVFDGPRVAQCLTTADRSAWCSILRSVTRLGVILASDPSRDLALLVIQGVPDSVRPIPSGTIDAVRPGDDVVVIGHPLGLLWSITTGIVSGIRSNYQISDSAVESTVVQTQTPVNPGNSGGPLLTSDGHLIGVIFGSPTVSASRQNPGTDVRVAAPGLNFAIGVNEVQAFISRRASGPR